MIRVRDAAVSFGEVTVLDGVDLAVGTGELVGVVGPNGAGKSTLLGLINGALSPEAGRVLLDGHRVDELDSKAASRLVATVPQDTAIGFAFTVEQVVEMGRLPHRSRLDWSGPDDAVEAALERTGTAQFRDRRVGELSGGERQRVLLARALAQETPALALDEPTASLDINHQVDVMETVRELVSDGRAAVAAIHDLDLAARYCDRLCLLGGGRSRVVGPPEAVLAAAELGDTFGTETAVAHNPVTDTPTVTAVGSRSGRGSRVHVTGTGSAAAVALGALWRAGFEVSVGPVPAGDVAAETAERLGVRAVTAPAFERPGSEVLDSAAGVARRAAAVVTVGATELLAETVDRHDAGVRVPAEASPEAVVEAVASELDRQAAPADD